MPRRFPTVCAVRHALSACLLLAASLAASAQPDWRGGPPDGGDRDRQRMREQLREQLRDERPPGRGGQRGDPGDDRPRLTPEERQALREQLRDQRRGRDR